MTSDYMSGESAGASQWVLRATFAALALLVSGLLLSGCIQVYTPATPIFARDRDGTVEFLICADVPAPEVLVVGGDKDGSPEPLWRIASHRDVDSGTVVALGVLPEGWSELRPFSVDPNDDLAVNFTVGPLDGEGRVQPAGSLGATFIVSELSSDWKSEFGNIQPCIP